MSIIGSRTTAEMPGPPDSAHDASRGFWLGLGRAFGGAILFSFPMLMTMEMWWLGFYMDPLRLGLYVVLGIPLLAALSYYAGLEAPSVTSDIRDAFIAYAIAYLAAALLLMMFSIIQPGMSVDEVVGKIAVQSVPASMGAMLARSRFGESRRKEIRRSSGYGAGLFLMAVGALYLSSSLASTEEMVLISYKMNSWQVVALALFSVAMMHGFLLSIVARGKTPMPPDPRPFWLVFIRFTMVGYAIALLISFYALWTFGRTTGMAAGPTIEAVVVLGFPAALGASAARLIL